MSDYFDLDEAYSQFDRTTNRKEKKIYFRMRADKIYEKSETETQKKKSPKEYGDICVQKHLPSRKKCRREYDNSRKRNALRKERKANKDARLRYTFCKRNLEEQAFVNNGNDPFTIRVTMHIGCW